MTVAQTILQQLGGNKFITMTGSKNFGTSGRDLSFKVGKNVPGINYIQIVLTERDDYVMKFMRLRGMEARTVYECLAYADELQRRFTEVTGLDTHL